MKSELLSYWKQGVEILSSRPYNIDRKNEREVFCYDKEEC